MDIVNKKIIKFLFVVMHVGNRNKIDSDSFHPQTERFV
jgi:hypothetical protein